eukprot:4624430-Pleurochrysis_carterae.AAC.1
MPLELKARGDASRSETELAKCMQRELERNENRQRHPERVDRQKRYRSYAAQAQTSTLVAGDRESIAEYDPRYSRMLSKMH